MNMLKPRIGELQDEIKRKDQRVAELRNEIDELRDLNNAALRENVEDAVNCIDSWKEAFDMVQDDAGIWSAAPWWKAHWELLDRYNKLARLWNKYPLPLINRQPRNVRLKPLAASDAQVIQVQRMRKQGTSLKLRSRTKPALRLQTRRTIIGQERLHTDRTSIKHLAKIDPDRAQQARWKARKAHRRRPTGPASSG